jgi:hypothetical protein
MNRIIPALCIPAIAIVLSSCANADESNAGTTATNDQPRRCMLVRNIDNYHPIDRNHVVIIGRGEDVFLLGTMRPGCWDIQSSHAIALETAPISLCEGQTATLMVSGERCFIRTLEAVTNLEAAETLVEQRTEADETDSR